MLCNTGFPEFGRFHLKITLQAALVASHILVYNTAMSKLSNCIVCGTPLQGKQTKFCSVVSWCVTTATLSYTTLT